MSDKIEALQRNNAKSLYETSSGVQQECSKNLSVASNSETRSKPDVRFVTKGGHSILDHQNILKTKSKKLFEWCNGYVPASSERIIVVSNVHKISLREFLKMVHTDEVILNENLTDDILVEVVYLIEKFWTMDKFFKFQTILIKYLKKTLTAFYSVIVFIKAREFHLKEIEQIAWGFICGFVKKVDKLNVTMNQDSISSLLTKEKIPEDSVALFEAFFRLGHTPVQMADNFSKSTNFISSVTLISFIQRLKWCINEFGESSNFDNIAKYLNADSFYSFCKDAFIDEDVEIQSGSENPLPFLLTDPQLPNDKSGEQSTQSSNFAHAKRVRSNSNMSMTVPKKEPEYFIRRLISCSEFIFPNRGNPESLSFVCDKAIKIVKLGLYGCQDVPSYINEYQVRASIVDATKNAVIGGTAQYFHNTGPKYYIHFDKPVLIMPHRKYMIVVRIKGPPSCIGMKKHTIVKIKCENTTLTVYFPPDEKDHGMKIPEFFFTLA